jgi:hypothetical protein
MYPAIGMMINHWPGIKSLADPSFWCGMPKEELQIHIAWCFEICGNYTGYVVKDKKISCLQNTKYSHYNPAASPVTLFQGDQQAIHIVRCIETNQWRKYIPAHKNTGLLFAGRQDQFKSTKG